MIPASYLFKNAYRGAWGTSQIRTEEAEIVRAIQILAAHNPTTVILHGSPSPARPPLTARLARAVAVRLYRWSRTGYRGTAACQAC